MIKLGLVSVTFRNKNVEEVIEIAKRADLEAIEWGGDIHVPPNDLKNAKVVGEKTIKAGLACCSYGSYYRVGAYGDNSMNSFIPVLETAKALSAQNIRVWAGVKGSEQTDSDTRKRIEEESFAIVEEAKKEGMTVSYECHGGTLTDTLPSYMELLENVKKIAKNNGKDSIAYAYFQPYASMPMKDVYEYLEKLNPYLKNLHVFNWKVVDGKIHRLPMTSDGDYWNDIFKKVRNMSDRTHYALMEFVKNDSDHQFLEDAKVLRDFLN
ncbi:MAG TPA: TIM barrel protein [Clostridia bacterium]|jgi:3-dehydroshikimate dehydratase|nr:TIM barrel protein [Clostridiaceae bacterium]HOA32474.1 TIM barrel protein [Clostridia bacterium]HPZ52009.1 TIM barrel protein [Clostridia bacterium]